MNETTPTKTPVLKAENISMTFGGIKALQNVDLEVYPGEIVGLVGDNGAGKSTLVKILSGVYKPTSGRVLIDGNEVEFAKPADARTMGIETIHQDLGLVTQLNAADNFFLGREIIAKNPLGRLVGHLNKKQMRAETQSSLKELQIKIPGLARKLIEQMSGGQRQAVAIARGVVFGRKMLMLDEPTAALGVEETGEVLRLMRELAQKNIPMLVISHNMVDVFEICDRIVVLRQGRKHADLVKTETTPDEVVGHIMGAKAAISA